MSSIEDVLSNIEVARISNEFLKKVNDTMPLTTI